MSEQDLRNIIQELDETFTDPEYKILNSQYIWPLVRYAVLFDIFNHKHRLLTPNRTSRKAITVGDSLKYTVFLLQKNPYKINKEYKFVFFTENVYRTFQKDGKFFNRVHDYFALLRANETVEIENSWHRYYSEPTYFPRVYSHDYIKGVYSIKSKLFGHLDNKDLRVLQIFVTKLREISDSIGAPIEIEKIHHILKLVTKKIDYAVECYKRLFEKIRPKIVFLNCASYGGMNAVIVKTAKQMGIKVGEFQHGVITQLHLAYNYGSSVFNNEGYKEYLPDYLLTYGDFWNEQVTIPSKKVTIGNPHFWSNYNASKVNDRNSVDTSKKILIVSQGTVTNINVDLAKKLSKMLDNNYRIVFRLHPGEVTFKERYQELFNYKNIEVNFSGDIYELIRDSDYVVSVYSTTIFEAASFGKPVYIYRHPLSELHIPENLGLWFGDAEELTEFIKNDKRTNNTYDLNYFWNENWEENYINFLEREIGV